jgi:acetyl-CoA C-acetyltransferase
MTRSVVITAAVRTAIGDFGGALSGIRPTDLGATVIREALSRAGLAGDRVEQVVMGNVIHTEPKDMYLARVAALKAGVVETAPALTLNRLCGSGLQAVVTAAEQILLGHADVTVAGGAECMSRAGHLMSAIRTGQKMGDVGAVDMMTGALTDPFGHGHMGITAENVAASDSIDRATQDAFALESHRRAAAAIAAGRFRDQIVPVMVRRGRDEVAFDTDEHVRPDLAAEDLARFRRPGRPWHGPG